MKCWVVSLTDELLLLILSSTFYSILKLPFTHYLMSLGMQSFTQFLGSSQLDFFCGYTCYIKSIVSSVRRVWWQISAPLLPLYILTKSLIFIANSVVHSPLTSKTEEKSPISSFVAFHRPSQQSFIYLLNLALMLIVAVRSIKKHIILLPDTSVYGLPQDIIINDIDLNPSLTSTSFRTTKILCSWSTVKLAKPRNYLCGG